MGNLKDTQRVSFNKGGISGEGKVVGLVGEFPITGGRYIIQPDKPINNEVYDYSHFVCDEIDLIAIETIRYIYVVKRVADVEFDEPYSIVCVAENEEQAEKLMRSRIQYSVFEPPFFISKIGTANDEQEKDHIILEDIKQGA